MVIAERIANQQPRNGWSVIQHGALHDTEIVDDLMAPGPQRPITRAPREVA